MITYTLHIAPAWGGNIGSEVEVDEDWNILSIKEVYDTHVQHRLAYKAF